MDNKIYVYSEQIEKYASIDLQQILSSRPHDHHDSYVEYVDHQILESEVLYFYDYEQKLSRTKTIFTLFITYKVKSKLKTKIEAL
jgi:hypothetical protein